MVRDYGGMYRGEAARILLHLNLHTHTHLILHKDIYSQSITISLYLTIYLSSNKHFPQFNPTLLLPLHLLLENRFRRHRAM